MYSVDNWLETVPELVVKLIEIMDGHIRHELIENISEFTLQNFNMIIDKSPKTAINLVRVLDVFLDERQINYMLEDIMRASHEMYYKEPGFMLDAVKLYFEYGKFDEVEEFFEYILRTDLGFIEDPDLIGKLLDVLLVMNDHDYIQRIVYIIETYWNFNTSKTQ